MNLQHRVALGTSLVISVVLLTFLILVLIFLDRRLNAELDQRLLSEAHSVGLSLNVTRGQLTINEAIEWMEAHHQDLNDEAVYIAVLDSNRSPVRSSANFPLTSLFLSRLGYSPDQDRFTDRMFLEEKTRFLVHPIELGLSRPFWIVIGKSYSMVHHTLWQVLKIFFLVFPIAIVLAFLGSTLVSRQSLRPIKAIAETARTITASDLTQRVPVPETEDDISQLAEVLNDLLDRLEATITSLRSLAANASHDIKTPVTILHTYLDRLASGKGNGITGLDVGAFQRELHRITHIIDHLAQIAKTDSGAVTIQKAPVWINDLLFEEVERARSQAQKRHLTLKVEDLPSLTVEGDEHWLHQAFENLLENAIKYSPEHGTIRIGLESCGPDRICVAIADEGPGVSEEEKDQLIQPYYRGKDSQNASGSGLGLSIVNWIVTQHGGSLSFEQNFPKGLIVKVSLPLSQAD
ncbi:MAG: sensor histidine kinase [Candidatus Neomarinimicrobiota bacterium]|nr:MAG: sensor histidine kinase [Candidatus Neomarinimicrobiota bacterium]